MSALEDEKANDRREFVALVLAYTALGTGLMALVTWMAWQVLGTVL